VNAIFLDQELRRFLLEDLGHAEVDTRHAEPVQAHVIAEADGIMCGGDFLVRMLRMLSASPEQVQVKSLLADGQRFQPKKVLADLRVHPEILRHGIRTGLNLVQILSGIATNTAAYVEIVEVTGCRILDTRKSTPGFRAFEKYAVRVGGGFNHRYNRTDGIILKKEDLRLDGGIAAAVAKAAAGAAHLVGIEVEVEELEQLEEALKFPEVTHILLDNMSVATVSMAVQKANGRKILEASGIDPAKLRWYADTGVPFISTSALVREARPVKMKMSILPG
jgi:nicotinate-nucleotide pyrophosphorylase (carboxylating)